MTDETDAQDWPLRAAVLSLAGAALGLILHFLLDTGTRQMTADAARQALAGFLAVAGVAFAFVVERDRQRLSLGFAVIAGLIVASTVYWSGGGSSWDDSEGWPLVCAFLTIGIAAPLFQAWRNGSGGIPYVAAHDHAWTNVVLWFASWVFVGIAWGLAYLLAGLFDLIGLRFVTELIDRSWFALVLNGAALGGAIGLLRDRERILGTLQRVVTTVLSVLAPALSVGLLAFLAALPFTGLAPLWQATKSTTPILIGCVIGALILCNAVIGDRPEDERRGVLRWSAMGLSLSMLPLGIIAAISTGLRIGQYGLTPDRLWASVFSAIACVYGLAYLTALATAPTRWAAPVRASNLRLGIGLCAAALILSTPLLGFGAISTRNQLARLSSGQTSAAKFDWAALRFDFGPAGKAALERMGQEGPTPAIRLAALQASKWTSRYSAKEEQAVQQRAAVLDARLRILPRTVPLPADLRHEIASTCNETGPCAVIYTPGAVEAIIVSARTWGDDAAATRLRRGPTGWSAADVPGNSLTADLGLRDKRRQARDASIRNGVFELREVKRRQLFIDGQPVGDLFD